MKLSAAGLDLIKKSEGFRSKTYLDMAGLPTIGYGHRLVHPECYPDGICETQADVILLWMFMRRKRPSPAWSRCS
jgi:GH24 family phage-related lysozyme (muramidase)